jgi:hypothetical protein
MVLFRCGGRFGKIDGETNLDRFQAQCDGEMSQAALKVWKETSLPHHGHSIAPKKVDSTTVQIAPER